jgi:hypothetical protein
VPPALGGRWRWVRAPPTRTRGAVRGVCEGRDGDRVEGGEVVADELDGVGVGADAGGPQVRAHQVPGAHARQRGGGVADGGGVGELVGVLARLLIA